MKKLFKRVIDWLKYRIIAITPGKNAVTGAAVGLFVVTAILWLLFSIISVFKIRDPWLLLMFLVFSIVAVVSGFVTEWVIKLIHSIPRLYKLALLITIPFLISIIAFEAIALIALIIFCSLTGASIRVIQKTGIKSLTLAKKIVTISGLVIGLAGFASFIAAYVPKGFETDPIANAAKESGLNIEHIDAESPALKGHFEVKTLTYGSGKDKHRTEFGSEVDLHTDSVDGVAFLDNWKGFGGWWREKYWGFDDRSLPLNARVWYPEGEGPFPLALVVHGNHSMQDYSDPGYDYLGELLASRGIILASVDQNFINGSWSDIFGGLETENDARGWLLLEHFRQWHEWNESPDHMFYGKVDTSRLALIGHSRGGEAVAHAAMFNALPYYPDDAFVKFDYNFNIRGIVAIAPVDGQYEPGKTRTKFKNVSYFVLHGAQDADVRSFMGSQQYERISFTDTLYHFKSGLYIYGANHGQFNTTWGRNDSGHPFTGLLNLKQLIPAKDQRQIAEVYISAFLETTLNERSEYLPLFADARTGREWLPETIYLNQFEDTHAKYLCTFDEDFDVSSATEDGSISSQNLTVWREQEIQLQWQKKGSRAVFLGWHYEIEDDNEDKDTDNNNGKSDAEQSEEVKIAEHIPDSLIASYSIQLNSTIPDLDSSSVFIFSMAESTENSNPKAGGKWVNGEKENQQNEQNDEVDEVDEMKNENEEAEEDDGEDTEEDGTDEPLDFMIHLTDSTGQIARFPLSYFSSLQREIEVVIWKIDFLKNEEESEKVFQLFAFPVTDMLSANPEFDFRAISNIKFVFNRMENGVVVVDNIGFMKDLRRISVDN